MSNTLPRFLLAAVVLVVGGVLSIEAIGQSTQVNPQNYQWGNSFLDGMERARRQRMQEEQLLIEQQRAAADVALREEQQRAMQLENEQRELELQQQRNQQAQVDPQTAEILNRWMANASKRSSLFPDFEQVVFAADVAITVDMIRLMADSQYAADIAYYLGKNKAKSYQVAAMPMLQQATAIAAIEAEIQQSPRGY